VVAVRDRLLQAPGRLGDRAGGGDADSVKTFVTGKVLDEPAQVGGVQKSRLA
jgi:hypothetical protein